MNKHQYFKEWNGKTREFESCTLTVVLKHYWTSKQMYEAVEEWREAVKRKAKHESWRKLLLAHAQTLHYEEKEARYLLDNATNSVFSKTEIEEAKRELERKLFIQPSELQRRAINTLIPTHYDFDVRLVGNGTVVVGNSYTGLTQDWKIIKLNGEVDDCSSETALNAKIYNRFFVIDLDEDMGVEVLETDCSRRVRILFGKRSHKQPDWYNVEILKTNPSEDSLVRMAGYGNFELDLAIHAAEALQIAAAIARDFDNFLKQPRKWLDPVNLKTVLKRADS